MKLKSLKEYIGDGLSKTKPIFKNKTNILKFYFLEFLYIVTLPLVITGPLVRLAYYNMVKNVSNGYKSYNVFDNFKSLADTKVVTKAILSSLIKDSINLSILLVLVLLSAPFFGLGWVLYINSGETAYFIIGVIPLSIMIIGYVYYLLFMHMPLTQVIVENPNISICETLRLSYTSYSKSDKHQIPLLYVFEYLFKGIILGLILSLIALEYNGFDYIMIFMILLLSIYLFFIPKCTLSNLVSRRDARVDIIKNYNSKDVEDYSERVFKLLKIDNNKDNDSKKKDKKEKANKDVEEVKNITLDEASVEVKEDESIINPNLVLEDSDEDDDSIDFLDETIDESDSIEEVQEEKEIEQKPFEQHDVEFEAVTQKTIDINELDRESTNNTIESNDQVVESSNEEIKEESSEALEKNNEQVESTEALEVEANENKEEATDETQEENNESENSESTNSIDVQEETTSTYSNLGSLDDVQEEVIEEVEAEEKPKKRGRKKKSEASSETKE